MDTKELTAEKTMESGTAQAAPEKEIEPKKEVETAPKQDAQADIFLQYREYEVTMEAVTERVKAHYYSKGYQKGTIADMQIYVKPEEFTAYYVINDGIVGKVNLF